MSSLFGVYGGNTCHDAGAVLLKDGKIVSAIQEERPKRIKVCDDLNALPDLSIQRIENEFNMKMNEADYVCTATPVSAVSSFWNDKHDVPKEKVYMVNHHDAHCYGAYYTSGFNEPTLVISYEDEGKVTGLAGHGVYDETIYNALNFLCQYDEHTMTFTPAGLSTSDYGIHLVFEYLEDINVIPIRGTRDDEQKAANLAYNVQLFLENRMKEYLNHLHKVYPEYTKVAVAGGVFSNVKLNQKLNELDWVDEMYVYPAMTDAGLALGATLKKAVELGEWKTKKLNDVFLGTKYSQEEIDSIIGWSDEQ